jgi:hypothetical protein
MAAAAGWRERGTDVIAGSQRRHARAHLHHDPGALVSANDGKLPGKSLGIGDGVGDRHVARSQMLIRVAQAGSRHLDQYLSLLGRVEADRFDLPLASHVMQDSGSRLHASQG